MSILNDSTVAEIRAEMARQNRSVSGLASALGITQKTARNRLSGGTPLSLDDLHYIAKWLGVSHLKFVPDCPPQTEQP
jgi:transcriptional regulator with XRE-family HTH domain